MQRLFRQPEQNRGNDPQGAVAVRALVVAGGQTAELLAPIDQPLDPIPQAVRCPIEGPTPPAVRAIAPPRVPFVPDHAVGPQPGPPAAGPAHRALLEQLLEHRDFVLLAGGEHQGQQLAAALRAEMDLRREAALAAPERFGRWVPPFAPAACWCARITVPSTKWTVQSSCPAASARAWTAANTRSQTPASRQRRKRLYSVGHGPYRADTSRQGTPVASFQRMPLRIVRWS